MSGIGEQRPKRSSARRGVPKASARADQYKAAAKERASGAGSANGPKTKAAGGFKPGKGKGAATHQDAKKAKAGTTHPSGERTEGKNQRNQGKSGQPRRHAAPVKGRMKSPRTDGHNKGSGVRTRRMAASVLVRVEREDAWVTPVLDEALSASDLDPRDKAFISNLVFSTARMQGTLDAVLNQVLNTPIEKLDPQVRATLRVGTWELLAGHAPDHAVVKSHVDAIAKAAKSRHFIGFTNGVLRGVIRQRHDFDWLGAKEFPHDRAMAFGLGYPLWIVEQARERFANEAQTLLEASNTPAPTCLRAIGNPDVLLEEIQGAGVDAKAHPKVPGAIVLTQRGRSGDLPWVQDHRSVIQDAASQAVVLAAVSGMNAGDRAVDLCAAPGGKAIALAQHDLAVQANDQDAFRLQRLHELKDAFGLDIAISTEDGRTFSPASGLVDLVVLDAPCSGLGVMRRRPEIRWRRDPDTIGALAQLQGELLDAAVTMVKPGGKLVYSVCTWTTAETDEVIRAFLQRHTNVTVQPVPLEVGTKTEFGVQLTPHHDQTDGMYIATFQVS